MVTGSNDQTVKTPAKEFILHFSKKFTNRFINFILSFLVSLIQWLAMGVHESCCRLRHEDATKATKQLVN